MTYVERRDRAVSDAGGQIAEAQDLIQRGRYGLAATALRDAARRLDHAASEQHCIDLAPAQPPTSGGGS